MQVAESLAHAASSPVKPGARRRLPVIQPNEVAGLVAMMHEQLDEAIDHRNAVAAQHQIVIACERGCNACCHLPVVVGDPEALTLARWLQQPEQAEVRERYLSKYPAWRAALGDAVEGVEEAPDKASRERACETYYRRRALCPFNHDGDCTVYPVRPALCRTAHAVNSRDKCQDEGSGVDTFPHPAVEGAYQAQDGLRALLHHSLRGGHQLQLLAKAVMRRLTSATAFPNQACPCGSGRKHKRCCGA
jgi:Fe-S-cluster containining protein